MKKIVASVLVSALSFCTIARACGDSPDISSLADGTAIAPSFAYASDPATGIYRSGTGEVAFTSSGALVGKITAAGLYFPGAITAVTGSAIGANFSQTLTAAADADNLVGVKIAPTFVEGAFANVTTTALDVTGNVNVVGTISGTIANISNLVYSSGWSSQTLIAPSQDSVYNKIQAVIAALHWDTTTGILHPVTAELAYPVSVGTANAGAQLFVVNHSAASPVGLFQGASGQTQPCITTQDDTGNNAVEIGCEATEGLLIRGTSIKLSLGSSGILIEDDGDGAWTRTGLGNGTHHWIKENLDDTSSAVVITSSIAKFDYGAIALASTVNQPGIPHHLRLKFNPATEQAIDNELCLWPVTDAAIVVDNLTVTLDATTNQVAGDLKYADAFIGLANATVINDFDTTSGVRVDASISSASVAAGKAIYLAFDSAPSATITQMSVDITYHYA